MFTTDKFSPEYDTRQEWENRLNGSVVSYKGTLCYVSSIQTELTKESRSRVDTLSDKIRMEYEKLDVLRSKDHKTHEGLRETQEAMHKISRKIGGFEKEISEIRNNIEDQDLIANISLWTGSDWDDKSQKVSAKDLDCRVLSPRYVNFEYSQRSVRQSTALYCSRAPRRTMIQGTRYNSLHIQGLKELPARPDSREFLNKYVESFNEDYYPSLDKCLDDLYEKTGSNSLAFHPSFSVSVDRVGYIGLYWSGVQIGFNRDSEDVFRIFKRFLYVKDMLNELGVPTLNARQPVNQEEK